MRWVENAAVLARSRTATLVSMPACEARDQAVISSRPGHAAELPLELGDRLVAGFLAFLELYQSTGRDNRLALMETSIFHG